MSSSGARFWDPSRTAGSDVDVTLGAALLAGLLSFLSPCVLPVVPAYLGQLGIVATAKPAGFGNASLASVSEIAVDGGFGPADPTAPAPAAPQLSGWRAIPNAFAFVLGFTLVFTVLGTAAYFVAGPLRDNLDLMRQIGGVILVILGLNRHPRPALLEERLAGGLKRRKANVAVPPQHIQQPIVGVAQINQALAEAFVQLCRDLWPCNIATSTRPIHDQPPPPAYHLPRALAYQRSKCDSAYRLLLSQGLRSTEKPSFPTQRGKLSEILLKYC